MTSDLTSHKGPATFALPDEKEQQALKRMIAMRKHGKSLRASAATMATKGVKLSHEGVAELLRTAGEA